MIFMINRRPAWGYGNQYGKSSPIEPTRADGEKNNNITTGSILMRNSNGLVKVASPSFSKATHELIKKKQFY